MLEVPSLLCSSSTRCCARVDFLSVGSNDLMQFLSMRSTATTSACRTRFDVLSAPALRALRAIADKANATNTRSPCAARWAASRSRRWR
jgi:phosphotransferase system enzyme I (PtsP)